MKYKPEDIQRVQTHLVNAISALLVAERACSHGDRFAVEDCIAEARKQLWFIEEIGWNYENPLIRETCSLDAIAEQYPDEPKPT